MTDALIPRLGGPMGRHAARVGPWFTPLPWAVLVAAGLFSLLFLRHVPCLQTEADDVVNSYIRACYSDLQPVFLGEGLGLGGSPLTSDQMTLPPLIAVLVLACRAIAVALGAPVGVGATLQEQVDASVAFFAVTTVALFACLLVVVLCVARLGRGHTRAPSWDAMLVAGSPIVLAVGLVDWTLVPVALTAVGLVLLFRGAVVPGAIVLGLAASAGTMPIAVVLAVVVAVGLRRGWRTATAVGVGAAASFLLVHAPLLLSDAGRVFAFYHGEVNEETGYGSLWYLLELMGVPLRATGSFGFAVLMLFLGVLIAWLYVTGRRPRVASLVAVVVLATTMLGAAYPPQTALWLLFVVVLALPRRTELVALTATQVAYYLAIWGWLGGGLTLAQSGPYLLYWLAIAFRWGVECWLLVRILRSFR
ncbi:MAG TPA: hypothetical protein PKA93_04640 [Arachnia sp.]|nr:hypothetical protein [Arachnia sp.]